MEIYIILIIFILFVILVVFMLYRNNVNQQLFMMDIMTKNSRQANDEFNLLRSELNKEFYTFQNEIIKSVKDDLNTLNKDTLESIHTVSKDLNQGLNVGFEKTSITFLEMSKQLVSIHETQNNLNLLSKDIVDLQNVLTDKKSRGIYGEIELYSILKSAYGLNDDAYQTQYRLSNNSIADAVLFAASPLDMIVIDSKFPLENYVRMYDDTLSKAQQTQASNQFSRDVKKHIDDISSKYIIKGETADMAYLFIPAEAIFSEINGKFEDIVHYSYKKNVFLVSPTTLMAYITALKAIYLGIQQNDKVDEIQAEFSRLAIEFERFETRYQNLMRSFDKVHSDSKEVNITATKIINRFKDIEAVELEKRDNDESYE